MSALGATSSTASSSPFLLFVFTFTRLLASLPFEQPSNTFRPQASITFTLPLSSSIHLLQIILFAFNQQHHQRAINSLSAMGVGKSFWTRGSHKKSAQPNSSPPDNTPNLPRQPPSPFANRPHRVHSWERLPGADRVECLLKRCCRSEKPKKKSKKPKNDGEWRCKSCTVATACRRCMEKDVKEPEQCRPQTARTVTSQRD